MSETGGKTEQADPPTAPVAVAEKAEVQAAVPAAPRPVPAQPAPAKTLDQLREELVAATTAVETARANLANEKEREKLDLEIGKIVGDYRTDYPAVKLDDDDLRSFVADEKTQLEAILSPDRIKQIGGIAAAEHKKIDDARASIKTATDKLAGRQAALADANADRDAAKATLDRWKKPAASMKERLKALEAFKAEIFKADEAGEYALAYWLLTDGEKLAGKLGEPKVIPPEELRKKIEDAWTASVAAADKAKALDAEVKTLTKSLDEMKADLAELTKGLEAGIRQRIAELPPEAAQAAPAQPINQAPAV